MSNRNYAREISEFVCGVMEEGPQRRESLAVVEQSLKNVCSPEQLREINRRCMTLPNLNVVAELRKKGASPLILLEYVAATEGLNKEQTPTRSAVLKKFQDTYDNKKAEGMTKFVLVSPVLFFGAFTAAALTATTYFVDYSVTKSVDTANSLVVNTAHWFPGFLNTLGFDGLEKTLKNLQNTAIVGVLAVGIVQIQSWRKKFREMKNKAASDGYLEQKIQESVSPLLSGFGPKFDNVSMDQNKLLEKLNALPQQTHVLLKQLSSVEISAFLMGDDAVRKNIIKNNPPSSFSEIMVLATSSKNWAKKSWDVFNLGMELAEQKVFDAAHIDTTAVKNRLELRRLKMLDVTPAPPPTP